MNDGRALRLRILAALAGSSFAVAGAGAGCGGLTTDTSSGGTSGTTPTGSSGGGTSGATSGGTSGAVSSSSGTSGAASSSGGVCDGRVQRTCYAPDGVIRPGSGYGGFADPDAAPLPPPALDANGCPVREEVMNGCCNRALGAATLESGQCCYEFCVGSCCGRPLRDITGRAIVAPPEARADWLAADAFGIGPARTLADLDDVTRAALVASYTDDALLEHASIASFATFTLQLLALGAPPELVGAAQEATADEVEHARTTFAIASALAGAPIGPGALPVLGRPVDGDLASIAVACVRDACIGETVASLVADAQAENAAEPGLQEILRTIAADEARHAELGWRFVAWAIGRGGEHVAAAVAAAFDVARPRARPLDIGVEVAAWRGAGRLTVQEHAAVVARAEREVIAPCRAALVARRTDGAPRRPVLVV